MKRIMPILTALCLTTPAAAQDRDGIAHGKALVEANCARCHGIGASDDSNHPEAPPFRTLSERYPLDALEEAFVEGITTGHPDMPEFVATPEQVADILAYIETLQP
jgi:mono/diheme cytochrome c family protein